MIGLGGGRAAGAAGRSPFAVELLEVFAADQPVAAVPRGRQLLGVHVAPQRRSRHAELFRSYGDRQQLVTSLHAGHGTKPATLRIGYHGLAPVCAIGYNPDTTVTGYGGIKEVPLKKGGYVNFRAGFLEPELESRTRPGESLGLTAKRDLGRWFQLLRDDPNLATRCMCQITVGCRDHTPTRSSNREHAS